MVYNYVIVLLSVLLHVLLLLLPCIILGSRPDLNKLSKLQGPPQYLTFLGALIKARSISARMVHMPLTMKAK